MKRILTAGAILGLTAAALYAQTATGSIQGTVYDSSKATVAGATVTLTDQQTNQRRNQTTNSAGWQIGMDADFASGSWLTPSSFGVLYAGTQASLLGDPNLPRSQRSISEWYNVNDVVNPVPGQLGTSAKGFIIGSGSNVWNIVAMKNFRVTEGRRIELRSMFYNPQAGKVTSASDYGYAQTERIIQFALKYYFQFC